jgi:hypothetical protein
MFEGIRAEGSKLTLNNEEAEKNHRIWNMELVEANGKNLLRTPGWKPKNHFEWY